MMPGELVGMHTGVKGESLAEAIPDRRLVVRRQRLPGISDKSCIGHDLATSPYGLHLLSVIRLSDWVSDLGAGASAAGSRARSASVRRLAISRPRIGCS